MLKKYLIVALLLFPVSILAQEQGRYIFCQSNEKEVYVHCFGFPQFGSDDSTAIRTTKSFTIKRTWLPSDTTKIADKKNPYQQVISVLKPANSVKELKSILGEDFFEIIKKMIPGDKDQDVLKYFKNNRMATDYPFLYSNIKVRIALGHVFVDAALEPGTDYLYSITRNDDDKSEEQWGFGFITAGNTNYALDYVKANGGETIVTDSLVSFQWKVDVSKEYLTSIPRPKTDKNEYQKLHYEVLAANVKGAFASVYELKNGQYVNTKTLIGQLNEKEDELSFIYNVRSSPNKLEAAYIRLQDDVYNIGIESDTVYAYTITEKHIPILKGINVTEIEDAIRISWKRLPQEPYVAGVLVYKINSDDVIDTVGYASKSDTAIIDHDLAIGQTYRYKAKAVYTAGIQYEQKLPAEGTGQYSKFSTPDVPTNLRAESIEDGVRLDWDHTSQQTTYGYYIYRGTKPSNVKLLDGPVKDIFYIDTSGSLSGRSTYFYKVIAQNYLQDTSEFSEHVSINPSKEIVMKAPENIEFYYENGNLHINWQDIRIYDNAIDGYILEKKEKGTDDENYERIEEILKTNSYTDSTIKTGDAFEYRVASVSYRGDESDFSSSAVFNYESSNSDFIEDFMVRNSTEGIYVSIPALKTADRVSFNIYRRKSNERGFKKLTSLKPGSFDYTDTSVQDGVLYVYAVTIINKQGKESKLSFSQSVRRGLN